MNMKYILLTSTAIIALSVPALAADKETYQTNTKIEKDTKGNFSEVSKTSKIEIDGTSNSFEKNVKISVDDQGNSDKTVTTEAMSDPKGLGNKHITTTKDTETSKYGQVTSTHEANVNGKSVTSDSSFEKDADGNYERKDTITRTDAAGTTRSAEKSVSVEVDDKGNAKKTVISKTSTDPKGLGNKTSEKVTDTKKTTAAETTTTHKKEVDGDVVDKSKHTSPAR